MRVTVRAAKQAVACMRVPTFQGLQARGNIAVATPGSRAMSSLEGTKTHQNLKEAFAGEALARMRYRFFAQVRAWMLGRGLREGGRWGLGEMGWWGMWHVGMHLLIGGDMHVSICRCLCSTCVQ